MCILNKKSPLGKKIAVVHEQATQLFLRNAECRQPSYLCEMQNSKVCWQQKCSTKLTSRNFFQNLWKWRNRIFATSRIFNALDTRESSVHVNIKALSLRGKASVKASFRRERPHRDINCSVWMPLGNLFRPSSFSRDQKLTIEAD